MLKFGDTIAQLFNSDAPEHRHAKGRLILNGDTKEEVIHILLETSIVSLFQMCVVVGMLHAPVNAFGYETAVG